MILVNGMKVSEVICLGCLHRWMAARPVQTKLADLECPGCNQNGLTIETGETSTAEELIRMASKNERGEQS